MESKNNIIARIVFILAQSRIVQRGILPGSMPAIFFLTTKDNTRTGSQNLLKGKVQVQLKKNLSNNSSHPLMLERPPHPELGSHRPAIGMWTHRRQVTQNESLMCVKQLHQWVSTSFLFVRFYLENNFPNLLLTQEQVLFISNLLSHCQGSKFDLTPLILENYNKSIVSMSYTLPKGQDIWQTVDLSRPVLNVSISRNQQI